MANKYYNLCWKCKGRHYSRAFMSKKRIKEFIKNEIPKIAELQHLFVHYAVRKEIKIPC